MIKSRLTFWLGVALLTTLVTVGAIAYFKEIRPRQTMAQVEVQQSYTFAITCEVKDPIKAVQRPWLLGVSGTNAWTYEIPCVSTELPVSIANGQPQMLPTAQPGLHFITVADSAAVSAVDWLYPWVNAGLDMTLPQNA